MSTKIICKKDGKERGIYFSEYDAEVAASVSRNYNHNLVPYECKDCGGWHLSRKEHYTPSVPCDYCTDANGNPKQLYETKSFAEKRARIIRETRGENLYVYECPCCNGYHLTHNKVLNIACGMRKVKRRVNGKRHHTYKSVIAVDKKQMDNRYHELFGIRG